jgi:pyridoxal phosphate enzyme (YggS family)
MSNIAQHLDIVRQRIAKAAQAAGRDPEEIKLLAVSKTRPVADILEAIAAGQTRFGESYLQEALLKIAEIKAGCEWHFIGPIQSNKTADIARHFDWVHSIDRLKIAQRLSHQRQSEIPLNICLQVNTSGEASKSGIQPAQLEELAEQVTTLPAIKLRGLMTIPAPENDPQKQRQPFRELRLLLEQLKRQGHELDTLSMGMTNDLESAIREGATLVRIGTAIFGARS